MFFFLRQTKLIIDQTGRKKSAILLKLSRLGVLKKALTTLH